MRDLGLGVVLRRSNRSVASAVAGDISVNGRNTPFLLWAVSSLMVLPSILT